MKKSFVVLITLFTFFAVAQIQAQEVPQPGVVRELSISAAGQGKPVAGVLLRADGEARSGKDGRFVLKLTKNKDNTFFFKEIAKEGYTNISPRTAYKHPINPKEPIAVILIRDE